MSPEKIRLFVHIIPPPHIETQSSGRVLLPLHRLHIRSTADGQNMVLDEMNSSVSILVIFSEWKGHLDV